MAISEMLSDVEVTAVTFEFGTVGPIRVLRAMQVENWMHHHGKFDDAEFEKAKTRMRQVYYPDTDAWKIRVWRQGHEVVDQTIARLSSSSKR